MLGKSNWRRAILVSCLVHCLFLVGAGWLSGKIFDSSNEPEYVELELINDIAAPEQPSNVVEEQAPVMPSAKPVVIPTIAPVAKQAASVITSDMVADSVVPEQSAAPAASGSYSDAAVPAAASAVSGGAGKAPAGPRKISAPRILSKVEPDYPAEAKQDGVGGTVAVKIEVMESGRPGAVQIARSSGSSPLDEAALQAVRQWRFVPAQEADSGRAIRCFTTLAVVFRLK